MIRIHALALVTLLELVVVFAALWLVWFFKARTLTRRLSALRSTAPDEQAAHGEGAYFTKELVATRAQIDALAKNESGTPPTGLLLRAAYLDLEREFAQGQQRDAVFWSQAQERIEVLRNEHAPPLPTDDPVVEQVEGEGGEDDDPQRVKHLIDAQVSTINELKEALAALLGEHGHGAEMIDQVEKLGRTNREMALCVSILEDDNNFLRDKLKAAGIDLE